MTYKSIPAAELNVNVIFGHVEVNEVVVFDPLYITIKYSLATNWHSIFEMKDLGF